ncbi:MAG: TetR/AcrR family transcriptional regulator [Planctomycetales bacterium]|nr:TetR/AcrR family transcriptional regulator [Planctomycetales bacterium]
MLAAAFGNLGYRRATTAELASRCDVQENTLYRLWPDKKAMFLAALDFLVLRRMDKWKAEIEKTHTDESHAVRLIELTGKDLGENGLYRIIFAALNETDDPDIKHALQRLYRRYHTRIEEEIVRHRKLSGARKAAEDEDTAWALIALVAFMNIALDLELMNGRKRQQLFSTIAIQLLNVSP